MDFSMDPGVLLAIVTIVAGFTIYSFLRGRHLERLQQIEKDILPDGQSRNYLEIKVGLLFIGVGAGIFTAFILNKTFTGSHPVLYPALIFLFGGIGLFTSFFVIRNIQNK